MIWMFFFLAVMEFGLRNLALALPESQSRVNSLLHTREQRHDHHAAQQQQQQGTPEWQKPPPTARE
jgi:hypothetical protein